MLNKEPWIQARWAMQVEIFENIWRLCKRKEIIREKTEEKFKGRVEGEEKGSQLRGRGSARKSSGAREGFELVQYVQRYNMYKGSVHVKWSMFAERQGGVWAPGVDGGGFSGRDYCSIVLPLLSTCANPTLLPRDFTTCPSQDLQSMKFYSEGLDWHPQWNV